jgi:hypothetical protein
VPAARTGSTMASRRHDPESTSRPMITECHACGRFTRIFAGPGD